MKGFGDCIVLIHEPHEFLKRVKNTLGKLNFSFNGDYVKYLDLSKYTGKKTVFQKDLKYEYQQEYRIFIKNRTFDPPLIEIGNNEDIAIFCDATDIDKLVIKGQKKDENTYTLLSNLKSRLKN